METQKWRTAPYRHLIANKKIIGNSVHEDNKGKGRWILPVTRRRFIQGLAAGGAVAALDWGGRQAFGETGQQQTPATLTGKEFELTIDSLPVKFTGRHSEATAVNGSVPGPILRWREVSGPLHPSRSHLQSSLGLVGRREGHLSLARFRSQQRTEVDDPISR